MELDDRSVTSPRAASRSSASTNTVLPTMTTPTPSMPPSERALSTLVEVRTALAATRSRKQKARLLSELLADLQGSDLEIGLAFLVGELRQGKVGLGRAATREAACAPAPSATLTLQQVDAIFAGIGREHGSGSKGRRIEALRELLGRATEGEQRLLVDLIGGELRQGAQEGLLLEAVALAAELEPGVVRRAAMLGGSLREVALTALTEGRVGLERFRLEVLRPLQPMLAGTAASVEEALGSLGRAALEWKLDGVRLQVHRSGDVIRAWSRSLHDVTAQVPEVVELVRSLDARELVLDGEVLALSRDGRPRPFQETMARFGRRLDVDRERVRTPLTPVFFDILLRDGTDLVDASGLDRSAHLAALLPEGVCVPRLVTGDVAEAEAFYAQALGAGHEGVLVKALDAPYEAGRRGGRWLKLKPAHTLDLVVLAAEWGSGRRQGRLSNLHLGARDPATGDFVMLGKTFKGMTDETLELQTQLLLEREVAREGSVVHVRPELVVEVAFDGVLASTQYPGAVALRFARLKGYRRDKAPEEADTIETVRGLREGGVGPTGA